MAARTVTLMSKPKYRNQRTTVDGHTFASKAEARRYGELKLLALAGEIRALTLHPRYSLDVNGVHVCNYIGDFFYKLPNGAPVTEDVKGMLTPVYKLKARLMRACHGIVIVEIR